MYIHATRTFTLQIKRHRLFIKITSPMPCPPAPPPPCSSIARTHGHGKALNHGAFMVFFTQHAFEYDAKDDLKA